MNKSSSIMLLKFEECLLKTSKIFSTAGVVLFLLVFTISLLDILGSKILNLPFPGVIELVGYSQAVMIIFALAFTQLIHVHVRVEMVFSRLPRNWQSLLEILTSILLFLLFAVLVWQFASYGISLQRSGQYSITLGLPIHYIVWIIAFALIPSALVFFLEFIRAVGGVLKK